MSTNCNGGIINIPQAFQGEDGISSYVYIAYADNVVLGTPDVVTNFQYGQPDPTSEWIAIITTNTPINNPGVLDFEDQWVKIKGTSGVGAAGINVENNNVAVTGGPFTTLNFFAAGLTGVTVTNAGGSPPQADIEIVTAGLNKRYFSGLSSEVAGSLLVPGASYWVVDLGDGERNGIVPNLSDCSAPYYAQTYPSTGFTNYPHTAGIILRALTANSLDSNGIYLARIPNRSSTVLFNPTTPYTTGNYVENYNEVYQLIGTNGTYSTNPANDPTNWSFIPKDNNTYYSTEIQGCSFDINTGFIKSRWDKRGNILKNTNYSNTVSGSQSVLNELIKKAFRWGLNDYTNNKITFYDNVLKSNSFRAPDYLSNLINSGGDQTSLVNYSTIGEFSNNIIDDSSAYNLSTFAVRTSGTRFFNNQLQNSVFSNNKIENSVITNLSEVFSPNTFINNTIKDSVINKFHYSRFRYNDISQFTVLGDIYYYVEANEGFAQSSAKVLCSSVAYATNSITNGIWNKSILNNLGSKSYVPGLVVGDSTSTATNSGANTLIQLNDTTGTNDEHYSQTGDIVYFITSPTVNLTSTFKPINTVPPSTTSFTVSGNITSSPSTGAFSLHIFYPAIDTSLADFNKNTLKNTVIRGVNKNCTSSTYFNKNNIEYTVIDNYKQHTLDKNSVYTSSCDFSGAIEFAGGASSSKGFSANSIKNSYFYANSIINDFTDNTINNAYFLNNGNTGTGGLVGIFSNNNLLGINTDIVSEFFPYAAITQTLFSPTIFFSGNNFNTTSQFYNNTIREYNSVTSCVLNAGSSFLSSSLEGRNLPIIGNYANYTQFTGLSSVTLNTNVRIIGITLKGRNAKLTGVTFGSNNNKEVNYNTIDINSPALAFFNRFTLENFEVNPAFSTGIYGSDALIPALFGDSVNMIRNISAISEGAPVAYILGAFTYQTTTFTFNVTTQMPHMINATGGIYSVGTEGLSTRVVSLTNYSTGAPAPGGAYFTFGSNSAIKLTGTITAIVDAYTLTFTASQTTVNDRLLHSTNAVVDSIGNPAPGIGLSGSYNDGGRDFINFPYWFKNIGNGQSSSEVSNVTYQRSLITPTYSELTTRIALGLPAGAPPAPPSGSRNYYVYYNYTAATTVLYDSGTFALTLPKYFELMGGTVIFGSHTAGTYQISTITNMPEGIPIRFVTTVGCAVRFNLVATSALASNRIVQDSAATTYTIRTYLNSSQYAYDEIVLMKQNGVIRIVNKIIHV